MSRAFRWRFQFSLCSLFFLVLAVAVVGSWLPVEMRRQRSERESARAIVADGGKRSRFPSFLRRLIRDGSLEKVTSLDLKGTPVTDADLIHLRHFPFLAYLHLNGTHITDAGLVHLRELRYLISLDLSETKVTDAGLENLRGLKRLELLYVSDTRISDAGLVHLREFTQLVIVCLDGTAVTEQGVNEFEQALPTYEVWR
ncbi:MAG: hypothetical protein FJ276_27265 [Planctomycetes bacterium]|nr:hypothetical protein [Planctomycetota bacterium]